MHSYDFRCKSCRRRFTLTFKTYADYDAAQPACPHCGSSELSRLIGRVAIKAPSRDYGNMSSDDMLSVFESGDSRAVGEMFQQVGAESPDMGAEYHEATQRLLRGESLEKVERDLGGALGADSGGDAGFDA
jgi:putative FmdB family regulatory protein